MNYFQAKSDLEFITGFHNDVLALWEKEHAARKSMNSPNLWMAGNSPDERQAMIQRKASEQDGDYQTVRKAVAQGVSRAQSLASLHGVPAELVSYPAPAVGGPLIPIRVFEAILTDNSYQGLDEQKIYDTLNRVIGACENEKERSWRELINPFSLIKNIVLMLLRLPFMLIEATGFNVSKFEDHFFGKLFKLLMLLGMVLGLIELGFEKSDLVEIMKTFGAFGGR